MNAEQPPVPRAARARFLLGAVAAAGVVLTAAFLPRPGGSFAAEVAVKIAPPAFDNPAPAGAEHQVAVFAGGCFWGVQAVFQHTSGVLQAVSGYSGGNKASATYPLVSGGMTEHAEAVQVTFDPKQVSYGKLLQIYFSVAHDPTQLNRQGPDTGAQYRSSVFYANAAQKQVAERYIAQLDAAKSYRSRIVTQVVPLAAFYPAEAYHQDYATRNPNQPYIATFDRPKLDHLRMLFPELYRKEPVLVNASARGAAGKSS